MPTPEKIVQNEILDYLASLKKAGYPIFYERRQAGGFAYKMGIPDIYCVVDGKHVEIEVKASQGNLRPLQEKFRDFCGRVNITWVCARSKKDVQEVIEKLL